MTRSTEYTTGRRLECTGADCALLTKADLQSQRAALALYAGDHQVLHVSSSEREKELRRIRSADPAKRNGSNGSRK